MHYQARLLVDDDEVVVLVGHVEGNVFGDDFYVAQRLRHQDGDDIQWVNTVILLFGLAIHHNAVGFGGLLYLVSRGVGDEVHQVLVDAQHLGAFIDHKPEMLV